MPLKSIMIASAVMLAGLGLSGCVADSGPYHGYAVGGYAPIYRHSEYRPRPQYHPRPPRHCRVERVRQGHRGHVTYRHVRVCR